MNYDQRANKQEQTGITELGNDDIMWWFIHVNALVCSLLGAFQWVQNTLCADYSFDFGVCKIHCVQFTQELSRNFQKCVQITYARLSSPLQN